MQSSARKNTSPARADARPKIALAVSAAWFALGCVALLLFPAARGSDPWLGWLPFWLVGVPAIEWSLLRLLARGTLLSAPVAGRVRARRALLPRRSAPRRRVSRTRAPASALLTALFVRQTFRFSP